MEAWFKPLVDSQLTLDYEDYISPNHTNVHQYLQCYCSNYTACICRSFFGATTNTNLTVICRENCRPTDTNSIPKELLCHILYDYIHNKSKIILFRVQNNLHIWPTKTSKLTQSLLHMFHQSLVYYDPVVGLMGLGLDFVNLSTHQLIHDCSLRNHHHFHLKCCGTFSKIIFVNCLSNLINWWSVAGIDRKWHSHLLLPHHITAGNMLFSDLSQLLILSQPLVFPVQTPGSNLFIWCL